MKPATITFTATVSPVAPGAGTPTGTVQFKVDGDDVGGPVTLNVDGVATSAPTATFLNVGSRTITAVYGGDANFEGSTATLTQTVT